MAHTPGPWTYDIHEHSFYIWADEGMVADGDPDQPGIARIRGVGRGADEVEQEANARLIASAPAMELALRMVSAGIARIERSQTSPLVEFCFAGLRYVVSGGDWHGLIRTIGWKDCVEAAAKAEAQ